MLRRPVESAQYTSAQIADAAADLGVLRSMGRTGVCWDCRRRNPLVDTEDRVLRPLLLGTKAEAKQAVGLWIEERYNRKRRHSSIGMISPVRFEEQHIQTAQAA